MLSFLAALAAAAAIPSLDAVPQTRLEPALQCRLGAYALPHGQFVSITGQGGHPRDLQYTLSNGQFGRLRERPDGVYAAGALTVVFEPCAAGKLTLSRGNEAEAGARLQLIQTPTTFTSRDGVALAGKLVMPPGGRAKALAVWIDGSNNDPSTDDAVWPYELARRGVAVFVYDKRGTGGSNGELSADFHVRAQDTAAAVREARRLAPTVRKVGVIGASQGGWVAPLTATLTPLDFVIPAFAMAEGPIAQDREVVKDQLRQAGFEQDIAKAETLTTLTARVVRSNFRDGFDDLDAFRAAHGQEAWMKAIQPRSYTGILLTLSSADAKAGGAAASQGLSFGYEPLPVIETIRPRQLWLLGGSDHQAPSAGTQAILKQVQTRRSDVDVVVFPKADHGLIERIAAPAGVASAYSARLFDIASAWIATGSLPGAGHFVVMPTAE
jgi:hypothetical protein